MECVSGGGGPPMNTDVSGIGVRVSFYLQTLFLSCLTLRSGSLDEITGALYTLLATNTAMAVTALILGFLPAPQISLHDALVVFYLLFLSWVTVCFSLTACAKFPSSAESTREKHQVKIKIICLHIFSIIQSYTIFAFALAVLITAKTFGNNPDCNPNAVVVLFRPFSALKSGRIVCWVFIVLVVLLYTAILIWDYFPPVPQPVRDWIKKRVTKRAPDPESPDIQPERPPQEDAPGITRRRTTLASKDPVDPRARGPQPSTYDLQIPWELIIKIILVVVVWSLTVMNIELLIRWNNFSPSGGQPWQFGQVLPLFLIVLPLVSLVNAFREPPPRPPKMPPSYV
ncbi:hypothetical protein MVEN_00769000 [Mycena venus]|uniref:Transmembrane protein n=1 Tax=Mycena venus TaxID=2733690 RepID=A0A8H6YJV4_9AGAR|nr:hypothetical protein MVEN_00769000 [Mycena venus]